MIPDAHASQGQPGMGCPFRRVLVAWDGSPDAAAALRLAAALVGSGPGHVVAMAVLPDPPLPEAAAPERTGQPVPPEWAQESFARAYAVLTPAPPYRIDLQATHGRPVAEVLCSHAREHGFDLLVLGRHGDGGVLHPRLGHVAEAAARASTVPVLLAGDR